MTKTKTCSLDGNPTTGDNVYCDSCIEHAKKAIRRMNKDETASDAILELIQTYEHIHDADLVPIIFKRIRELLKGM